MTLIAKGATVLFQGDSVTDAGRSREDDAWLGSGYPSLIAALFTATYPELGVRFVNRGVSGDRVRDLRTRWQHDCIDVKPDWVSILIGINDCWRRYDSSDPTSAQDYETVYRDILKQAAAAGARLLIVEPFLLPCPPDRVAWRVDLDPKIDAARRLARELGAVYVPMDGLFAAAATQAPPEVWAGDGVHPSPVGHALIAQAWLRAVKAL